MRRCRSRVLRSAGEARELGSVSCGPDREVVAFVQSGTVGLELEMDTVAAVEYVRAGSQGPVDGAVDFGRALAPFGVARMTVEGNERPQALVRDGFEAGAVGREVARGGADQIVRDEILEFGALGEGEVRVIAQCQRGLSQGGVVGRIRRHGVVVIRLAGHSLAAADEIVVLRAHLDDAGCEAVVETELVVVRVDRLPDMRVLLQPARVAGEGADIVFSDVFGVVVPIGIVRVVDQAGSCAVGFVAHRLEAGGETLEVLREGREAVAGVEVVRVGVEYLLDSSAHGAGKIRVLQGLASAGQVRPE